MKDLRSLTYEQLCEEVKAMGQPSFRAKQIYSWLHEKRVTDFSEMTNLSAALREKLASVCKFTFGAPAVLAICYDKDKAWKNDLTPGYCSGETDAAIVCTHMMMEAWELGIGSCWVAWFNADEVHAALSLPENVVLCGLLPIGYPAEDAAPTKLHTRIRDFNDTIQFM